MVCSFRRASVNLADDDSLLQMMRAANFFGVFVGIESPDPETLVAMKKKQNTRRIWLRVSTRFTPPACSYSPASFWLWMTRRRRCRTPWWSSSSTPPFRAWWAFFMRCPTHNSRVGWQIEVLLHLGHDVGRDPRRSMHDPPKFRNAKATT